jgi:sensor c-di-GMP phosphodiesterase-like protein
MLCWIDFRLRMLCSGRRRRSVAMQQLSFFEVPAPDGVVPVWTALDNEQRAKVIAMLAQLIAKTIAEPEHDHE